MPGRADWLPLPIAAKLFQNIDESALTRASAALENTFATEADGQSRFPGLKEFADFSDRDNGRVYLSDWRGDLMASTSHGALFRLDENANVVQLQGVPISGGGRTIFTKTEKELVMSAGGDMVRYTGEDKTELMTNDPDAPKTTHTGFIDSFLLVVEKDSGRFVNSEVGDYPNFDPLDTFAADGTPDNITSLLVTPYREVMLCGPESIEQFERSQGVAPFFRRYSVGEGVKTPYTITFADNAVIAVNQRSELVRISGQVAAPISDDIGLVLEKIDNWTDAWMGGFPDKPLHIKGQKFILLQIPNAATPYGTKGLTYIYDYRKRMFSSLYGWDAKRGMPARWPGWSYWPLWDKVFVGGEGKIYTLDLNTYNNGGDTQRWLVRTAFIHELGESAIDDVRIRIKRGIGSNTAAPNIRMRCNRDNTGFGPWVSRSLGLAGERHMHINFGGFGQALSWQFELECTADCAIELARMEVQTYPVGT
jgi:hypothetical protein